MKISLSLALVLSLSFSVHAQAPVLVQDINTAFPMSSANPNDFMEYKGALYFFADDGVHDDELWKYDESGPATMVYDLNTTGMTRHTVSMTMTIYQNKLYFSGQKAGVQTIFVYDGINPPTEAPGLSGFAPVSDIINLKVAGNNLYFVCSKSSAPVGQQLYVYNGTSAPVRINLPDPMANPGPAPQDLIEFRGKLYYTAYEPVSKTRKMFQLDPATNSFSVVTTSFFPDGFTDASYKYASGEGMYFTARADSADLEVFLLNGATATRITNTWPTTTGGGAVGPFALFGGFLYYSASTNGTNRELYKCNPSGGAGALVMTGGPTQPTDLIVYKNKLYFSASSLAAGYELWRHDATGTKMVADLFTGTPGGRSKIQTSIIFNNHLYLNANDGVHGEELFRLNDPTEVRSMTLQSRVQVYPNPSSHTVTMQISLDEARSLAVTITDVSGRQIFSSGPLNLPSGASELVLPLHSFAVGQYFYRLTGNSGALLASGSIIRK